MIAAVRSEAIQRENGARIHRSDSISVSAIAGANGSAAEGVAHEFAGASAYPVPEAKPNQEERRNPIHAVHAREVWLLDRF